MKRRAFRDLPLLWRLQIPFLALMLASGLLGGIVIVRDLGAQARARLDTDVARAFLNARSRIHDRELYALESANFAANMQGMAEVVASRDGMGTTHLLQSVLALKTDVELLVATDSVGFGVAELARGPGEPRSVSGSATSWAGPDFVRAALASTTGQKTSGLLPLGGVTFLAIAAPICATTEGCHPVGVAIAGISLSTAVAAARSGDARVGVFDRRGRALGVAGRMPGPAPSLATGSSQLQRRSVHVAGKSLALLEGPLTLQDKAVGILAAAIRSDPALGGVRSAGLRLALVLLVAMGGIVAVGALLSRAIVAELQRLAATNRALGSGDLAARARVGSGGELGELAAGINQMAEQLQANVETLELRVTERTEEIRRLLNARSEFFAGLSHELRTPIAAILAQADLLASNEIPGSAAGPILQASGRQLLQVVNEILELAKAEAGRIEVELSDVRVDATLRELKPTFAALAATGDVRLSVKIPRGLPAVRADVSRLREVLLNLVDNAVKYTPPGGRVEVSAAARNGEVDVLVTDTGVGIPPEGGAHIFEPFFRVKGTEAHRGQDSSGLGLAIAKRLIEAQGGTIAFESGSQGTTFKVGLLAARRIDE